MTFVHDKKIGKVGEKIAKNIIQEYYQYSLEDVSEDREWQKQDVDFLVNDGMYKVEVKTDTTTTPNIFFETESNSNLGTLGCMLYTTADILFYVHLGHDFVLTAPVEELRDWVLLNYNSFREVGTRTSNARGLLLPIRQVINEVPNVGILNMDGTRKELI